MSTSRRLADRPSRRNSAGFFLIVFLVAAARLYAAEQQYTQNFELFTVSSTDPPQAVSVSDGFVTFSGGGLAHSGQAVDQTNLYMTEYPFPTPNGGTYCVGCQRAITITFAQPVSHPRFRIVEPSWDGTTCAPACLGAEQGFNVTDDLGHTVNVPFPAGQPDTMAIADLPYSAITTIQIESAWYPTSGTWLIRIDDLTYYKTSIDFSYLDGKGNKVPFGSTATPVRVYQSEPNKQRMPDGQTDDHQFELIATLHGDPQLSVNQQLFFRVVDPAEVSNYGAPHAAGDNLDWNSKAGALSLDKINWSKTQTVSTDSNLDAQVYLNTSSRYAGDNYIVQVSTSPAIITDSNYQCATGCYSSGMLTSWKRIYAEVDAMFRTGAFIQATLQAGATVVQVPSTAIFGRRPGAAVRLVHAPRKTSGGTGPIDFYYFDTTVAAINGTQNTITLANPVPQGQAYYQGTDPNLQLADGDAIAVLNTGGDYYNADISLVPTLDQEAFTDYVPSSPTQPTFTAGTSGTSCDCIPFVSNIDTTSSAYYFTFPKRWLDRTDSVGTPLPNTHHIIGVRQVANATALGQRSPGYSVAWIAIGTIETYSVPKGGTRLSFIQESTAHEATHIWSVNYGFAPDGHCAKQAYVNGSRFSTESCLMQAGPTWNSGGALTAERCDGVIELHYDPSEAFLVPDPNCPTATMPTEQCPTITSRRSEFLEMRAHADPFVW